MLVPLRQPHLTRSIHERILVRLKSSGRSLGQTQPARNDEVNAKGWLNSFSMKQFFGADRALGPTAAAVARQSVSCSPANIQQSSSPDPFLKFLHRRNVDMDDGNRQRVQRKTVLIRERALQYFKNNQRSMRSASELGLSTRDFNKQLERFLKAFLADSLPYAPLKILQDFDNCGASSGQLRQDDVTVHDLQSFNRKLSVAFLAFLQPILTPDKKRSVRSLVTFSDLRFPHEWYPIARKLSREVHLHIGPTNSGKTHHALERLISSKSGIYLAPLRLLAQEVFDKLNEQGRPCNLITGEIRKVVSRDAKLYAATVEMAPLSVAWDTAVIDEYQLMGDPSRGWAWTSALLGLRAREINLCGDESAVKLVKKICATLGDTIHVHRYERLAPLVTQQKSLKGYIGNVKRGDCVVSFSRKSIYRLKSEIEAKTGLKCAMVYGSLPPETRTDQARLFNVSCRSAKEAGGYDVLVASDAVGMGLNLSIKRVVFERLEKFDGKSVKPLAISEVRQISGRAGRYKGSDDGPYAGEVTTLHDFDLQQLRTFMEKGKLKSVEKGGLTLNFEQLQVFATAFPDDTLLMLLSRFEDLANLGEHYFLCNLSAQKLIAHYIEPYKMPLRAKFTLLSLPLSLNENYCLDLLVEFASCISSGMQVDADELIKLPKRVPRNMAELQLWEISHQGVMAYLWLSYRFPRLFHNRDSAKLLKEVIETVINDYLELAVKDGEQLVRIPNHLSDQRFALDQAARDSSNTSIGSSNVEDAAVTENSKASRLGKESFGRPFFNKRGAMLERSLQALHMDLRRRHGQPPDSKSQLQTITLAELLDAVEASDKNSPLASTKGDDGLVLASLLKKRWLVDRLCRAKEFAKEEDCSFLYQIYSQSDDAPMEAASEPPLGLGTARSNP